MKHWRVIAGAAALSALLSVIAGGVGGVAVGAILVRMLVAAVAFAGLSYGAVLLLEKYVPEVLTLGRGAEQAEEESGGGGSHLDITLPEENPHADGALAKDNGDDVGLETLTEAPTAIDTAGTSSQQADSLSAASYEVDDLDSVVAADAGPVSAGAGDSTAVAVERIGPDSDGEATGAPTTDGPEALEGADGNGTLPEVRSDGLGDINNTDGAGSLDSETAVSEYGSAQDIASAIRTALSRSE